MPKTTRHVLKADEVALEGPLRLGLGPTAAPAGSAPRPASTAATVRVIQNHSDYAVIEVTCSCGRVTEVRCEYATADASPGPQESTPA
jgi:hypothetical protein